MPCKVQSCGKWDVHDVIMNFKSFLGLNSAVLGFRNVSRVGKSATKGAPRTSQKSFGLVIMCKKCWMNDHKQHIVILIHGCGTGASAGGFVGVERTPFF